MTMKKALLFIFWFCVTLGCKAQTDTEFWFAAPDLDVNHAEQPIRFCVVSYEEAATVVFEQPANAFYSPQTFHLEAHDCYVYDVSNIIDIVETQPYNAVLDFGFYIHSDTPVSIYYESDNNNSEIYSLKGKNALGTSFVVPMQYSFENYYSSTCSRIEVVASQDDTEVTFYPSVAIKGGGQPGIPVTVNLDRGQSYAIEAANPQGSAHLRNTRITSTKPIAVNTSDDSVNLGGHYDLVGDQIVPVDLLGTDYIAIWNNNPDEYLFFFPTEDNTSIYLNGGTIPVATLDVGQEYMCQISSAVVYIHADKPISVFQLSSSSQNEFGGTVLPQISCTGSRKTVYKRQSTSNLVVTLIVKTANADGFVLNGNSTYITAADFTPVPANPDYSYCKKNVSNYVPTNGLMSLENTYADGYFHLGILTGDEGATWNYGYFSDYQPYAFAEFLMGDTYCSGQDIEFYYSTENVSNLVLVLPDGTEAQLPFVLNNAQTEHSGRYSLRGEDCNGVRVLDVIDITINEAVQTQVYINGCNSVVWHDHTFLHSIDTIWTEPGSGLDECDSVFLLHFTVYPPNDTMLIDPTICVGDTYDFHGTLYDQDGQIAYFDTVDIHGCLKVEMLVLSVDEFQMPPVLNQFECYTYGTTPSWYWDKTGITYHEDTYDEIVLDDPNGGCPIKHRLNLKFHEAYYHEESKEACGSYYWPVTGQTYYDSQDPIIQTFHYAFGDKECDSTYVLHLVINDYETSEFEVPQEESCDGYLWDPLGKTYTTDDLYDPVDHYFTQSGSYHRTYTNMMGCDSIVTMNMHLDYTPSPTEIYPMDTANIAPHWVITPSEFQINSYDFYLWEQNPDCHWDTVAWSLDEPSTWILKPFGNKGSCCKVYVLNHVDDTVWLSAHVFNRCDSVNGVEKKYWLISSFYGIEENGASTGASTANFEVLPNPNNGQMTLQFEHLTGRIDVKIYDMKGVLVDNIETHNEGETNSMQYNFRGNCGVYFIVVTGKEGVVAKKVIVR